MRYALIILTALTAPAMAQNMPGQAPVPVTAPAMDKADPPMSKPSGSYREYLTARLGCIGNRYFTCMALAGWQYDPAGFQPPRKPD